ncbi:hypothetical protein RZE82_04255 [Mollicutes bacterium LVI A0039]|nr:hypothetical protein RZE82_04255 [Mollicutes bacterium LVI A0039]
MIFVYLLFCVTIGLINRKTNVIYALLLGILGLNFFLNGNKIIGALQSLVAVPKLMFQNPQAVLLVAIIALLFILSNLLNLINVDYMVDRYVGRFSHRRQKIITFFVSFFSTNLDLSHSDLRIHHKGVYDINSGIMPFANPTSIIVIFISSLLVMFDSINGISVGGAMVIILFNIPAIWWGFKTLVQLIFKNEPTYVINVENMNLIRPSIEVEQSIKIQSSLNGIKFIKRFVQLLLIPVIFVLFIPTYKVYWFIIIYILSLIAYTIYLGVKAVYEERIMSEEEIYRTIRNSILGIGPELVSFLLTLIFASLSYDFIARYYANIYTVEELYLLSIIGLLIGMMLFKDYLIGIAMALPITLIWITSDYAIDLHSVEMLYISLISFATLIQIFYIIDFKYVNIKQLFDLLVLVLVTISTLAVSYFVGTYAGVATFFIFTILYYLYFKIKRDRGKNDNPRHT